MGIAIIQRFAFIIKTLVLSFLLLLSTLSFADSPSNEMNAGSFNGRVYKNDFFGFTLNIPKKWVVQGQSKLHDLIEDGGNLHAGEDAQLRQKLTLSEMQSISLFAVFQYPVGRSVKFNPSIIAIAEPLSDVPDIKSGGDYLKRSRQILEAGQLDIEFLGEIESISINEIPFDLMHLNLDFLGTKVRLEHYAVIKNEHAIVFVISYVNDTQKTKLNAILDSIRFE